MFTAQNLNEPEMQALEKYGIAVLSNEVINGQQFINAAVKTREPVVRDRIDAVRWCNNELGFESSDGVIAGMASNVLLFGTLKGDLTVDKKGMLIGPLEVINQAPLAVDFIVDNFKYGDFITLSLLMGKPMSSQESMTTSSEESSSALPTAASE